MPRDPRLARRRAEVRLRRRFGTQWQITTSLAASSALAAPGTVLVHCTRGGSTDSRHSWLDIVICSSTSVRVAEHRADAAMRCWTRGSYVPNARRWIEWDDTGIRLLGFFDEQVIPVPKADVTRGERELQHLVLAGIL